MKNVIRAVELFCLIALPYGPPLALAGEQDDRSALGLQKDAFDIRRTLTGARLERYIEERLSRREPASPYGLCLTAELMKHAGDSRAEELYQRAIAADPGNPAYELFYADYLRNYRGSQRPLFPQAELHYLLALQKSQARRKQSKGDDPEQGELASRIERGMIALYQRDGVPLIAPRLIESAAAGLSLSVSSINRYAETLTDFDEVDDVRIFTSEAAFAQVRRG